MPFVPRFLPEQSFANWSNQRVQFCRWFIPDLNMSYVTFKCLRFNECEILTDFQHGYFSHWVTLNFSGSANHFWLLQHFYFGEND